MSKREHHLLCLGLLAKIYFKATAKGGAVDLDIADALAIEEAISSAEQLGMPVSVDRLIRHQPISKE